MLNFVIGIFLEFGNTKLKKREERPSRQNEWIQYLFNLMIDIQFHHHIFLAMSPQNPNFWLIPAL